MNFSVMLLLENLHK